MREQQTSSEDPIGSYATMSPPTFVQVQVPTRSRVNVEYLKSIPGILKCTAAVCNICILLCGLLSGYCWDRHSVFVWADITSSFGIVLSAGLTILYLLRITENIPEYIPWWRIIEMVCLYVWSIFHLAVGISCAYYANRTCKFLPPYHQHHLVFYDMGALGAASFFGFVASGVYGTDAFFTTTIWKAERRTNTTVINEPTNGEASIQP